MGFRYELKYPSGETELSDDVYETEAEARSYAEDDVLAFASGADVLDDMGESYDDGELEYSIIEEQLDRKLIEAGRFRIRGGALSHVLVTRVDNPP